MADVPGRYDLLLDGTGFMLFEEGEQPALVHQSIRQQREQAGGASVNIGEATVNPEGFWRRSRDGWHHGAGQTYCVAPETRVLTSDLRWVPAGDLELNDSLVAFEEFHTSGNSRQWREASVLGVDRITQPCWRLLLADGTKLIASSDHRWLVKTSQMYKWVTTKELRREGATGRGSNLLKVFDAWETDHSWGAGYLAAAFDGEGSYTQSIRSSPRGNRTLLYFTQRDNDMLRLVELELLARGFEYTKSGKGDGSDVVQLMVRGGARETLRLLGSVRPRRLLANLKPLHDGGMRGSPVAVVEKEFLGEMEVVALRTSTKTFFAEGFASHNSDRDTSDPERFRDSRGIDVFGTTHQATLCKAVELAHTAGSNNTAVFNGGQSRVYVLNLDSATLKYTTAPFTLPWSLTTVTGTPAAFGSVHVGFAMNGTTGYIAGGANGIYSHSLSSSTAASFATGTVSRVWWVKGRLMAAEGLNIYNVTAAGALPSPLTSLLALDMCDGPNHIYILSYDNGAVVYKTAVKPDGTALDVPTVAGKLNPGDAGLRIFGWAGRIFVTTTQGVHMADVDGDGNLIFGARIPTDDVAFISGMAGDDRFVFIGNPITGEGPGLLKLDLTTFTLPSTPAYAHDLAVDDAVSTDDVISVVSFGTLAERSRRIFTAGAKVYVESDDSYVTTGYIKSGLLALDLADSKTPVSMDVEGGGLDASETIVEALSADRGATFTTVGTWNSQTDASVAVTGVAASRQFEIRTTLNGDGTATPILYRHTLAAEPNVNQSDYIIARLRLYESVVDNTGAVVGQNPSALRAALRALQQSREVVSLVEGDATYNVTVRDMDDEYQTRCAPDDGGDWNSVATIRMKVISDG